MCTVYKLQVWSQIMKEVVSEVQIIFHESESLNE